MTDDTNEVLVAFEIDTVEHAEAFLAKADQAWLEQAGLEVTLIIAIAIEPMVRRGCIH